MAKTYVEGLRIVLAEAYRYGTRYQNKMAAHLTAPQLACLASTLQAISDCIQLLGPTPINP